MNLLGATGWGQLLVILFFLIFVFLLPIISIVDIIQSEFKGNMKWIWLFAAILFNFIGAIFYLMFGRYHKV
jgi:hypothetical protein